MSAIPVSVVCCEAGEKYFVLFVLLSEVFRAVGIFSI